MNPDLDRLQPYPFEKLNQLKLGTQPPLELPHIALSIGEPKHEPPALVSSALIDALEHLGTYPSTKGLPALREAITSWASERFGLGGKLDPETQVLPVNGTREALFAFVQAAIDRHRDACVVMPNPFYQIYEGAALLAGATPVFVNCLADNGFLPDWSQIDDATWARTQLVFICSPGNPTGAVATQEQWQELLALSDRHDFIIAADECYSELYPDEQQPPVGLLQAALACGRDDFRNCVVFHSLSKRSNVPGLRSGFVAGDQRLIQQFLLYRTYHGCAMPVQHQYASIAAWQDEEHVRENRRVYRQKFTAMLDILSDVLEVEAPQAGFYLWAKTPISDTEFARGLFDQQHVTVLPGRFLARDTATGNPGEQRIRMALVAPLKECIEAAKRIRTYVESLAVSE